MSQINNLEIVAPQQDLSQLNSTVRTQSPTKFRSKKEQERTRKFTRKKKSDLVKQLQQQQYKYYLQNQQQLYNNQIEHHSPGNEQSNNSQTSQMRTQFLDEYSETSTCCFGLFKRKTQRTSRMTQGSQNSERFFHQAIERIPVSSPKPSNQSLPQTKIGIAVNSDEWLIYLQNNLQNLEGLRWADNLTNYIEHDKIDFKTAKFRSQIYFLNYTKQQLSNSPLRRMISQRLDDSIKNLRSSLMSSFNEKNVSRPSIARISIGIERDGEDRLETSVRDSVSDIYEFEGDGRLSTQERMERYLYDIQTPKVNNPNMTILENMNSQTKHLFEIIQQQLQNNEHPLNKICQRFAFYYSRHYSNQILQNDKSEDFYLVKETSKDKFELQVITELQRVKIEENFAKMAGDEDDDLYEEDDDMHFEYQRSMAINSSFKQSYKRPTFVKQAQIFRNESEIMYKTSMEAIVEVKQFLCLMYGSVNRFYSTVLKMEVLEQMREDLIETMTKIVFNEKMSKLMTAICRITCKEEEKAFAQRLFELYKVRPSQLGLNPYFTLDKTSNILEFFQEQYGEIQTMADGDIGGSTGMTPKDERQIPLSQVEKKVLNSIEEQDEEEFDDESDRFSKNRSMKLTFKLRKTEMQRKDSSYSGIFQFEEYKDENDEFYDVSQEKIQFAQNLLKEIEMRLKEKPYAVAIEEFRNITEVIAPLDKVRCILQVSTQIVKCINNFWSDIQVKQDKLTIDGDSLLIIYIYIALKSKITDIFAQIKLMNEFLTPFVRTTKLGYCLTTMEIALNHIINLSKEEILTDYNQFGEFNMWTEAKHTLTKSIRESINIMSRPMSLVINDDPFENYSKRETFKF